MSVAIGLDVGTSGVKALAVAEDGEIVGRAEVGYGLSTPKPGWAHTDVAQEIKRRLSVPVVFDTDVNAAAFGEHECAIRHDDRYHVVLGDSARDVGERERVRAFVVVVE